MKRVYPVEVKNGILIIATKIKIKTKAIFKFKILIFTNFLICSLILRKLITKNVWATISKIMKQRRTIRLNNLYKSLSNLIPRNKECKNKNMA